jgi:hypothetical protein
MQYGPLIQPKISVPDEGLSYLYRKDHMFIPIVLEEKQAFAVIATLRSVFEEVTAIKMVHKLSPQEEESYKILAQTMVSVAQQVDKARAPENVKELANRADQILKEKGFTSAGIPVTEDNV